MPTPAEPKGWLHAQFKVGIGIEFGEVATESVVIDCRKHVLIIGEVVNVAARLAEIAKPNEILIGKNAYQQVRSKLSKDILSRTIRKRGKHEKITCWKIDVADVLRSD